MPFQLAHLHPQALPLPCKLGPPQAQLFLDLPSQPPHLTQSRTPRHTMIPCAGAQRPQSLGILLMISILLVMNTLTDHCCSSTVVPGSTGFAVGTAPIAIGTTGAGLPGSPGSPGSSGSGSGVGGAGSTGSPIVPVGPSKTGSSSPAGFTGAATKNVGSVAAGLLAVAGLALAL